MPVRFVCRLFLALAGGCTTAASGIATPFISPHLSPDPSVRVSASCTLGGRKFKCAAPLPHDGAVPRWANASGTLYDLSKWAVTNNNKGKKAKSGGPGLACRAVPAAPAPGAVALVREGRCSLAHKGRLLSEAGWGAAVVAPGHRFKPKDRDSGPVPLPMVTVAKPALKQLAQAAKSGVDPAADKGTVRVVLASLRKEGAHWKTARTLYQEGKKMYLAADTAGAIRAINASLALDARALPAHYTLANYACDQGDADGAVRLLRGVLPPPAHHCEADAGAMAGAAARAENAPARTSTPDERRLRVVTVATNPRAELDMLRHSIERNGLALEVLGLGETYSGLGFKIVKMWEFLRERVHGTGAYTVPDDDVILFTDAYDVVFTGACSSPAEFLRRFDATGTRVLLGAELELNPDYSLALLLHEYNHTDAAAAAAGCPAASPAHGNGEAMRTAARARVSAGDVDARGLFPFLNSGTYMGRAADLRSMFEAVLHDIETGYTSTGGDPAHLNDQRWFYRYLLAQPHRAALDSAATIFHTLHWTEEADFELLGEVEGSAEQVGLGVVRSKLTDGEPCLLHGNGDDGKLVLDSFFDKLSAAGFLPQRTSAGQKYGGW